MSSKRCLTIIFAGCVMLSSCTVSVILTDTHGSATDVVDQTSRVDPDVDAEVDLSAAKVPPITKV